VNVFHKTYYSLRNKIREVLYTTVDFRSAKTQLLSDTHLSEQEKTWLRQVSLQINASDGMYNKNAPSSARQYLSVGLSAIHCIDEAVKRANKTNPIQAILDLPCGYGRVLRFLKVRFPSAEITASEIDLNMINFCRHAFSVKANISNTDLAKLSISESFDLIWCGSLITHIDRAAAKNLLHFFCNHLSPGGICVFTTHGQLSADRIRSKPGMYGLTESARQQILIQYDNDGYGYVDYEKKNGYGISVVSYEHMTALANSVGKWRKTSFYEHGWDEHQDVYGYTLPLQER